MSKRSEMWARVHELSCSHQHIRADECPICREQFRAIIDQACVEEEAANREDK